MNAVLIETSEFDVTLLKGHVFQDLESCSRQDIALDLIKFHGNHRGTILQYLFIVTRDEFFIFIPQGQYRFHPGDVLFIGHDLKSLCELIKQYNSFLAIYFTGDFVCIILFPEGIGFRTLKGNEIFYCCTFLPWLPNSEFFSRNDTTSCRAFENLW